MEYAAELKHRIQAATALDDAATAQVLSGFACRRVAKRELLLRAGEQCDFWGFVQTGLVRLFTYTVAGEEHTTGFAQEGAFLTDIVSFGTQVPSQENMEALEDTVLVYLTHASLQRLWQQVPAFERFGRLLYEERLIDIKRRVFYRLYADAPARYQHLLQTQPVLLQRVPLKYLASYLSVTSSTLSRIRRKLRG